MLNTGGLQVRPGVTREILQAERELRNSAERLFEARGIYQQ